MTYSRYTNSRRIARALECEIAANRFTNEGWNDAAIRARRAASIQRRRVARLLAEAR